MPIDRDNDSRPGGTEMKTIRIRTTLGTVLVGALLTAIAAHADERRREITVEDYSILSEGGSPDVRYAPSISGNQPLRLAFMSDGATRVSRDSIRIRYGRMRIDITERVLDFIEITEDSIAVDDSILPTGSHRIRIELTDSQQRRTVVKLRLSVKPAPSSPVKTALATN